MARTVRDSNLANRTGRMALAVRGRPYFRMIDQGLHLGYRRLKRGAGVWIERCYSEGKYLTATIGTADDLADADGVAVLNFTQAQARLRGRMVSRAHTAAGITGPLTVKAAIDDYLTFLETNRKSAREAKYAADALILPTLGAKEVSALTADDIRRWHAKLAATPARIRTKTGDRQQFREAAQDPDNLRRRKSTANRILTTLKAALNRAFNDGKAASDSAWRRVQPFEGVDSARTRYLSLAEAQRLLNASDSEFRRLARGALETGARYGELVQMLVSDFNPDSGTLLVHRSKAGKPRHIILTQEGAEFFAGVTAGRKGDEALFVKDDGGRWLRSHQKQPMKEANARGRITPPINFHGLRHTWASLAVMNGVPLMVVARNLGHSDTRMVEKHYGHLAPSFVADAIRAGAPRYGMTEQTNVRDMRA